MIIYCIFLSFYLFNCYSSLNVSLIPVGNLKGIYDPETLLLTRCKTHHTECYGGVSRLLTRYNSILSENKIFLNTGNNFKLNKLDTDYDLTASFNILKALKFDIIALGNEDFDMSKSELFEYINIVQTPIICTNLKPSYKNGFHVNKSSIVKLINPIEDEQHIAFLSVIDPDKYKINRFKFLDPIESISQELNKLKKEKINNVVLICYCSKNTIDIITNSNLKISTIIREKDDTRNTILETEKENNTVIFELLSNLYLSEFKLTFDSIGNITDTSFEDFILGQDIKQDDNLSWFLKVNNRHKKNNKQIGFTKVNLLNNCFEKECNLINLILKSMVYSYINETETEDSWTFSSIAVYNPFDLKSSISKGIITLEDIFDVFYNNDKWDTLDLKGEELLKLITMKIKDSKFYFEGIKILYFNNTELQVFVKCNKCLTPTYELLNKQQNYKIIISRSTYNYYIKDNLKIINYKTNDDNHSIKAIIKYITKFSPLIDSNSMNIIYT